MKIWPTKTHPQWYSSIGAQFAIRSKTLGIEGSNIIIKATNQEHCGANFWINKCSGKVVGKYTLEGAGAVYAIATDGFKELTDISRNGVTLTPGTQETFNFDFNFTDPRVKKVVIGIRLNEGVVPQCKTGILTLHELSVNLSILSTQLPVFSANWLVRVPVEYADTGIIWKTFNFVVSDAGTHKSSSVLGSNIDEAINHIIEEIIFPRINYKHLFEVQIARTATQWKGLSLTRNFYHAGRRYQVFEL